jgi:hypothetical protein
MSDFPSRLTFPQWAIAQQPIAPVPMTPFGDGQASVLTGNLQYRVLQTTFVIVVPAGFVTDFASTPRALWSVIPPTGRYQLAAVVHDFLYWDQGCTREQADAIFRVAMAESNVKPYERDLMWQAVRRFGHSAWNDNAAAKQAEKPRIVPAAYMNIPPLVTWSDYQDQLVRQGRRDELLKLAELFHSQARRTGTPAVKQTLHRMGQYYQNAGHGCFTSS